jgi:hypothetical protein
MFKAAYYTYLLDEVLLACFMLRLKLLQFTSVVRRKRFSLNAFKRRDPIPLFSLLDFEALERFLGQGGVNVDWFVPRTPGCHVRL